MWKIYNCWSVVHTFFFYFNPRLHGFIPFVGTVSLSRFVAFILTFFPFFSSFLCCLWCYPILFTFLLLIFVIHGKICSFNKSQYDQFSSKLRKIAFNFIPSLSIYSCSHSMYFLTFKYFLLQFYVFFLNSVAEILLFSQTYYTHHTSLVNYLFPFYFYNIT